MAKINQALMDRIMAAGGITAPHCAVAVALESMPADIRATYEAAIDNPLIAGTGIRKVLQEDGHILGADAVQRHRRKDCRCARQS